MALLNVGIGAVAVFFCWKWFLWKLTMKSYMAAVLRWLEVNNIEPPDPDTIKEYQKWAVKMILRDTFRLF